MSAGYSGTPLGKKLGVKPGFKVAFIDMPVRVRAEITSYCDAFIESAEPFDLVHLFGTDRAELSRRLTDYMGRIEQNGMIWVSWPKKASKVPTDVTEDVIREVALPRGLVDVKVCAVDEVWSGLKLVIRKELRV